MDKHTLVVPNKPYKSRTSAYSLSDDECKVLPAAPAVDAPSGVQGKVYTVSSLMLDNSEIELPAIKATYPPSIDTLASEASDGQIVYYDMKAKDAAKVLSHETHKVKRERIEQPVILVIGKPNKRANKAKLSGYYTMLDNSPSVLGDKGKDSNTHTVLAGKDRGERAKYPYKRD